MTMANKRHGEYYAITSYRCMLNVQVLSIFRQAPREAAVNLNEKVGSPSWSNTSNWDKLFLPGSDCASGLERQLDLARSQSQSFLVISVGNNATIILFRRVRLSCSRRRAAGTSPCLKSTSVSRYIDISKQRVVRPECRMSERALLR